MLILLLLVALGQPVVEHRSDPSSPKVIAATIRSGTYLIRDFPYRMASHATNKDSGGVWVFEDKNKKPIVWKPEQWEKNAWRVEAGLVLGSNSTDPEHTMVCVGLVDTRDVPHRDAPSPSGQEPCSGAGIFWIRDWTKTFTGMISEMRLPAGMDWVTNVIPSRISPVSGGHYRFQIEQTLQPRKITMRLNDQVLTFHGTGLSHLPKDIPLEFAIVFLSRTNTGVLSADLDYVYTRIEGSDRY